MYKDVPGMHRDLPGMHLDLSWLHWAALGCTGMHWDIPMTYPGYPGGFRGGRYALAKYAGLNAPMVTSQETPVTSRLPPGYLPASPGLSRGRPPRHRRLSPVRIPYGHPDSPGLSRDIRPTQRVRELARTDSDTGHLETVVSVRIPRASPSHHRRPPGGKGKVAKMG